MGMKPAPGMNIVRRRQLDGVIRQARTAGEQKRSHKLGIAIVLTIVLCSSIAAATLVNYLSQTAETAVTVKSPITLTSDFWLFNEQGEASGGSEFELTTDAYNDANQDIYGVADLHVEKSVDEGNSWQDFDFGPNFENGITVYCNQDIGTPSLGHIYYFSGGPITFPSITTIGLLFHVIFAPELEPADYRFSLTIRPS